eukprot:scaffold5059_cov84-Alexandrium_tamarense.AAC.2
MTPASVLAMYLLPVGDVSYDFVAHREDVDGRHHWSNAGIPSPRLSWHCHVKNGVYEIKVPFITAKMTSSLQSRMSSVGDCVDWLGQRPRLRMLLTNCVAYGRIMQSDPYCLSGRVVHRLVNDQVFRSQTNNLSGDGMSVRALGTTTTGNFWDTRWRLIWITTI